MGDKTTAKTGSGLVGAAAIQAGSGLLGLGLGNIGRKNQMADQEKLMGIQMANQMALNQQGHDLQLDMWNKTNYEAQIKHMIKAGLNPGLMYGQSGGGGTTTGSQSGGSASGGNAPQGGMPMELMAQMAQIASQTRLNNAQAGKLEKETPTTGNLGDTTIESLKAGITNTKALAEVNRVESELKNIDYLVKSGNVKALTQQLQHQILKTEYEMKKLKAEKDMTQIEADNFEKMYNLKITKAQLENGAIAMGIKVDKAQIELIAKRIDEIDANLDYEERKVKVMEALEEFNTGVGAEVLRGSQAFGNVVDGIMSVRRMKPSVTIEDYDGSDKSYRRTIKNK